MRAVDTLRDLVAEVEEIGDGELARRAVQVLDTLLHESEQGDD
jgi:hypothetical protein